MLAVFSDMIQSAFLKKQFRQTTSLSLHSSLEATQLLVQYSKEYQNPLTKYWLDFFFYLEYLIPTGSFPIKHTINVWNVLKMQNYNGLT